MIFDFENKSCWNCHHWAASLIKGDENYGYCDSDKCPSVDPDKMTYRTMCCGDWTINTREAVRVVDVITEGVVNVGIVAEALHEICKLERKLRTPLDKSCFVVCLVDHLKQLMKADAVDCFGELNDLKRKYEVGKWRE